MGAGDRLCLPARPCFQERCSRRAGSLCMLRSSSRQPLPPAQMRVTTPAAAAATDQTAHWNTAEPLLIAVLCLGVTVRQLLQLRPQDVDANPDSQCQPQQTSTRHTPQDLVSPPPLTSGFEKGNVGFMYWKRAWKLEETPTGRCGCPVAVAHLQPAGRRAIAGRAAVFIAVRDAVVCRAQAVPDSTHREQKGNGECGMRTELKLKSQRL